MNNLIKIQLENIAATFDVVLTNVEFNLIYNKMIELRREGLYKYQENYRIMRKGDRKSTERYKADRTRSPFPGFYDEWITNEIKFGFNYGN
jgi:hypothetical protein